jgi:tetratricopeptide (TPR) repeat protein
MNRNWDFVGAKSDLDVAMRIDPNNIELLQAYASFLWITGKLDQALAIQRRCVTRNPLASKTWDWLGVMLMNARDYPAARQALQRSQQLSPYSDYRFLLMTLVEIYAGDFAEAMRLARSNPDAFHRDYTLALAAFSLGQTAESQAARERLIAHLPDQAASQIAVIYAWQGDDEQAFVWLDRAIALRDPGLFGIQTRPGFDRFKDDPRFQRVLRLMNVVD